jgi:TrmH family RNA methyltransferase
MRRPFSFQGEPVISSPDNQHLKTIRKLREKRHRERLGLFAVEGEDLLSAARAAGVEPVVVLEAGVDVEPELLDGVSTLGSGTRVIGVFRQRWVEPAGALSVWLEGVSDPGNVGTIIRSAHAFADGPVVLGPGCADPYGPKAVRASMGSVFARPPARAEFGDLHGSTIALDAGAPHHIAALEAPPPVVLCLGGERDGLGAEALGGATLRAAIPLRAGGPESLNVAMAAAVALYECGTRMAPNA